MAWLDLGSTVAIGAASGLSVDPSTVVTQRLSECRLLTDVLIKALHVVLVGPEAKKQQVKARYQKRIGAAERRVERTRGMLYRARIARDKVKAQYSIATKKRTWNLGTSLKSYIDPRVYHQWGKQVDYDVLQKYYPKALRRKFNWVKDRTEGAVLGPSEAPDGREGTSQGPGSPQETQQPDRRKRISAGNRDARKRYTAWALGLGRRSPRRRTRLAGR